MTHFNERKEDLNQLISSLPELVWPSGKTRQARLVRLRTIGTISLFVVTLGVLIVAGDEPLELVAGWLRPTIMGEENDGGGPDAGDWSQLTAELDSRVRRANLDNYVDFRTAPDVEVPIAPARWWIRAVPSGKSFTCEVKTVQGAGISVTFGDLLSHMTMEDDFSRLSYAIVTHPDIPQNSSLLQLRLRFYPALVTTGAFAKLNAFHFDHDDQARDHFFHREEFTVEYLPMPGSQYQISNTPELLEFRFSLRGSANALRALAACTDNPTIRGDQRWHPLKAP